MGAALITALPAIISGAPGIINAITGIIGNLVHKHQGAVVPTSPSVVAAGGPVATPASGPEKKAAAMNDFALFAGPLIALLVKLETGKDVDVAALEPVISSLIDQFVLLNKVLGIFQPTAKSKSTP